ncbi:hypothetical protein EST38_g2493 [Candolleomyces aberdarensis]|uniref:RING-type E3 ubiquitin transferase n=1 Tax=Candolleomyces aberdarensis TaxID=2316362 RepID=A0A4Q2DUE4_9AGAR|nr:hypothetical protein EST38_g2493 [Candolleomyces aberdarensis]
MPSNEVVRQRLQHVAHFANNHRLLIYSFVSLVALGAVITNALKNYSNFYSVAIYLSKSSRSVLALANFGILIALLCGHFVQRIFFGTLRANEVERLYDRLWFFITESLLAFTIFRDEFDTPFALMFGFLLFIKSFHWLASDRIEWMDQRPYPGPPLLFHFRMVVLFSILYVIDLVMFFLTVEHTLSVGVDGMVLFASEYGILIASVLNTICKYALSAYELRRAGQRGGENAPPWENKSMWVFYIELATDFLKLTIYLLFFTVIITFYGLPLNIVRDVYITARSFVSRLKALRRYQTATRNMDQRYPNATEEELTAMSDRTCIICREEMVFHDPQAQGESRDGPNMAPKKLPCGHIFHFYCLRSWLERQQSCPTCRRTVLDENIPPNPRANNPPPPAPGQAPLPPNPGLPAAPQPAGNNPLAIIENPLPQERAAPPANPGTQNPVAIQYELEYQQPNGQGGAHRIPPIQGQQPLNPVPPFAGFRGPYNAWQNWQVDGANPTVEQTPEQRQEPASSTTAIERNLPVGERDSDSESSADETETLSPREAARAAALKRFGSNNPRLAPTRTRPASSSQSNQAGIPTSGSSTSVEDRPISARSVYPQLIPIYDLGDSASQDIFTSPVMPSQQAPGFPPHVQVPPALQQQPPFFGPSTGLQSQLSTRLTDEQLATMDRLTREAIDERLKALERVSNTIYGCIDDLMRMRSALPELHQPSVWNGETSARPHETAPASTRQEEKRPEGLGHAHAEDARTDSP